MEPSAPRAQDCASEAQGASGAAGVQAIAWAAQKRLCARYRRLYHAGKAKCQVTTAVARP